MILRSDVLSGVPGTTPSLLTITSLSPNPSRNTFTVQYRTGGPNRVDVDIFDVAGRRVLSRPGQATINGERADIIDTTSLAAGVYFLRVTGNGMKDTRKFVVVR